MKIFVLWLALFCSSAFAQGGFIAQYHPLPNAKKIAYQSCKQNLNGLVCPHGRVLVRRTADGQPQVQLELFGQRLPIRFKTMPGWVGDAWNTDLNRDGKADLIVKLLWGGNGIAGDANITVFALSSKTGYQLSAINTISFDPDALVVWRGRPTVLHTSLLGADSSKTGRNHSFWVFYPLSVRGARLVADNAPIWVQFTFVPSHRPTNKLTRTEKATALKQTPIQIFEPLR